MERLTTDSYLSGPESLHRREVVWGILREPPAPFYGHQRVVTDLAFLLQQHTRERDLGQVCVSPIDVVLDGPNALILQPDIVFIATDRLGIVKNQIWGAPDLVVEVLSPGTAVYDRRRKLGWYRKYGVRECWFVDPRAQQIVVRSFEAASSTKRAYKLAATVESRVLPLLQLRATDIFGV